MFYSIKTKSLSCSFLNTLVNTLKIYTKLYSYKPDIKIILNIYNSYGHLQKALLKPESPPTIEIPTHNGTRNVFSCSLKTSLIESFEEATCHISAYTYPLYEKVDIIYKNI